MAKMAKKAQMTQMSCFNVLAAQHAAWQSGSPILPAFTVGKDELKTLNTHDHEETNSRLVPADDAPPQ